VGLPGCCEAPDSEGERLFLAANGGLGRAE